MLSQSLAMLSDVGEFAFDLRRYKAIAVPGLPKHCQTINLYLSISKLVAMSAAKSRSVYVKSLSRYSHVSQALLA